MQPTLGLLLKFSASGLGGMLVGAYLMKEFGVKEIQRNTLTEQITFNDKNGVKLSQFWLSTNVKTTCTGLSAKHEYEAFTHETNDPSSRRITVDNIAMVIDREKGNAHYRVEGKNTSYLPHTDRITGWNICGKTCVVAEASKDGSTAVTKKVCVP